jgi:uncharacterized alkaline shock family protein YloU
MEEKELMEEKKDTLKISDEVVAVITGVAASETEGVFSVGTGSFASGWTELLGGKKNNAKGIKVVMGEGSVTIEIQIVVKYGVRITDVAASVQENVKNAVEEMTGFTVEKVDVRVVGIKASPEAKKEEAEKEEPKEKA